MGTNRFSVNGMINIRQIFIFIGRLAIVAAAGVIAGAYLYWCVSSYKPLGVKIDCYKSPYYKQDKP